MLTGGRVERTERREDRERNWILELTLPPCLGIGNWARAAQYLGASLDSDRISYIRPLTSLEKSCGHP